MNNIFASMESSQQPNFFEDVRQMWLVKFKSVMDRLISKQARDPAEQIMLEIDMTSACYYLAEYWEQYLEHIHPYMNGFIAAILNFLNNYSLQPTNDLMIINALSFLTSVAERNSMLVIPTEDVLNTVCRNVIIHHMEVRDHDLLMFQKFPSQWIDRDLADNKIATRRRMVSRFTRVLWKHFKTNMLPIFTNYMKEALDIYSENPLHNWKSKVGIIFLLIIVSSKEQDIQFTNEVHDLVNINRFYKLCILDDIHNKNADLHPILKTEYINFLINFHSVLNSEYMKEAINWLGDQLSCGSAIIITYAACAIDKMLQAERQHHPYYVVEFDAIVEPIYLNLLTAMQADNFTQNEYLMKAFQSVLKNQSPLGLLGVFPKLLSYLTKKLQCMVHEALMHMYIKYLFESLAILVKSISKISESDLVECDKDLLDTLVAAISMGSDLLLPFCLQLVALLLECQKTSIRAPYENIVHTFFVKSLWNKSTLVTHLVRITISYLEKACPLLVQRNHIINILGIFRMLHTTNNNNHEGFRLLYRIILHVPKPVMRKHLPKLITLISTQLTNRKTDMQVLGSVVSFNLLIYTYSLNDFFGLVEKTQTNMFEMVFNLMVSKLPIIASEFDKKICVLGMCTVLSSTLAMDGDLDYMWLPILQSLVDIINGNTSQPESEYLVSEHTALPNSQQESVITNGFMEVEDPLKLIFTDSRVYLGQVLAQLLRENRFTMSKLLLKLPVSMQNSLSVYPEVEVCLR